MHSITCYHNQTIWNNNMAIYLPNLDIYLFTIFDKLFPCLFLFWIFFWAFYFHPPGYKTKQQKKNEKKVKSYQQKKNVVILFLFLFILFFIFCQSTSNPICVWNAVVVPLPQAVRNNTWCFVNEKQIWYIYEFCFMPKAFLRFSKYNTRILVVYNVILYIV